MNQKRKTSLDLDNLFAYMMTDTPRSVPTPDMSEANETFQQLVRAMVSDFEKGIRSVSDNRDYSLPSNLKNTLTIRSRLYILGEFERGGNYGEGEGPVKNRSNPNRTYGILNVSTVPSDDMGELKKVPSHDLSEEILNAVLARAMDRIGVRHGDFASREFSDDFVQNVLKEGIEEAEKMKHNSSVETSGGRPSRMKSSVPLP